MVILTEVVDRVKCSLSVDWLIRVSFSHQIFVFFRQTYSVSCLFLRGGF